MKKVNKIKKGGKLGTGTNPAQIPNIQVKSFQLDMGQQPQSGPTKTKLKKKSSLDKKASVDSAKSQKVAPM